MQDRESSPCIPKAFASVVNYAGFELIAQDINETFNKRKYCLHKDDPNLRILYVYAPKVLPTWLQCSKKDKRSDYNGHK